MFPYPRMPKVHPVYMWHRSPEEEKCVNSVAEEILERVDSDFLSRKRNDGYMKLKLKDTPTQTNSLQNLSVIEVTEALEEFCAKSCYKSKTNTK